MKLPIPFGKKEAPEYLLALLLRQEKATAVIIEQQKSGSKIVGSHEEYFQTNLEDAPDEEWLKILDATISKAEETLPPNVETHKTIFGVPASWVEEKHIKKEYLAKLKKASDELTLTPVGFLEIPEAIAHLLLEEEGAPVSAILAEIGKEYLALSLIRGGKIIDTKFGKLQETPVKDVDTLLRSFANVEVFPSRIVIFNGGHDEMLVQQFISHQWSRSLPFLHVPQISVLPKGFDAKAIVFGAATQMGFDVSGAFSLSQTEIKTFHAKGSGESASTFQPPTDLHHKMPSQEIIKTTTETDDAFGFVKGKDIAIESSEKTTAKEEVKEMPQAPESEGEKMPSFTVNSPYKEESNLRIPDETEPFALKEEAHAKDEAEQTSLLQKILALVPSFGTFSLPVIPKNKGLIILIPAILVVLIGLFAAYTYLLHATITVLVSPKGVDQNVDITFATDKESDFSNSLIGANTTSISLPGKATGNSTGKKETGTKAKGTVTLFNSSDNKKQLSSGTVITSSNDLDFTLDKDVTIASATGDIFSGIKSGTADVGVTAKQIGSEYNIPSNIKFSVGSNDSVAARNESAFSGGSKKNITVVAQKDIDDLTASLPKSIEEKARETLSNKLPSGDSLLTVVADFKPSKKDFTAQVGDEAKTITLSSSATFEAISYKNDDLIALTKETIKEKFDPQLTVADKDIKNSLKNVKKRDDGSLTATLNMRANLLPKIEKEKLQNDLAGKPFAKAREILLHFPQVEEVNLSLFPPIPFLPEILPHQPGNITINVQTND